MKVRLKVPSAVLAVVLMETTAYGQANFLFRNLDAGGPVRVDAPVFDALGIPLAGTNYFAELFGGADSNSLTPLVLIDSGNLPLIKPFATGGYVVPLDGGLLVVPTVPPGGWAWLQMRAWESRLGATYEEAAAQGLGGYGESFLFYAQGGDPFNQFPEPGRLIGLQSFSLRPVPEPYTWALFAFGGSAVWWAAGRQRWRRPK